MVKLSDLENYFINSHENIQKKLKQILSEAGIPDNPFMSDEEILSQIRQLILRN